MGRMQTERFRAFHRSRGEAYRWYKAYKVENPRAVTEAERDGNIYEEQYVNPAWKALVHQTERDFEDAEFGFIAKGAAAVSVMPDETRLARGDRLIFPERTEMSRALIVRGEGSTDDLVFKPVSSIVTVRQDTTIYVAGTDYKQTGDTVEWLDGNAPDAGEKYMVEYLFNPTYTYIGRDSMPRPGNNGLMPQRGAMLLYQPSE